VVDSISLVLQEEKDTLALAGVVAQEVSNGLVFFLHGELGAGKTTFVRGFLRALGYKKAVKSPTYTLVEDYQCAGKNIFHFDLYRLADPEELEFMGIRDYFAAQSICFIEWPEKGHGFITVADVELTISYGKNQSRCFCFAANSELGRKLLNRLSKAYGLNHAS